MLELLSLDPSLFLVYILAILLALSVHEFAHALASHLLGDDTARLLGRLSLNPRAHLDLFGSLSFLLLGFGWGKPVPVNPMFLKNRRRDMLIIALAGPFSNLLMLISTGILLKIALIFLPVANLLIIFLSIFFTLNIVLMIFNLLPLPPLDGYNIIAYILPNKYKYYYIRYGYYLFLTLIVFSIAFNMPVFAWISQVVSWFYGIFNLPLI